jgi:hypothetical protein
MKKLTEKEKVAKEKAAREAMLKERHLIQEEVLKGFHSAEDIAVDTECKIVDFYVSNEEFNLKKIYLKQML